MGVLLNARHEAFARSVADGVSAYRAYVIAGYKESPSNAYTLRQRPEVIERIREIVEKKSDALEKSIERASTRTANALEINRAWVLQGLVNEASTAKFSGERTKAFELVGKELGMFIQRTEVGAPGDFANLDSNNAILDAVALELGAETAASLRAIISPPQATQPMKVIEHDSKEVIEHQSRDCDDQ